MTETTVSARGCRRMTIVQVSVTICRFAPNVRLSHESKVWCGGLPAARSRMQLMTNDALIAKLCANLKPIRGTRARMSLLIAAAAGGGTAVAIALFWPSLGPRPDLWAAALTTMFWVKVIYTASLAVLGFGALGNLSRPDSGPVRWARLLWPPVSLLFVVTALDWAMAPATSSAAFWMGSSWWQCPVYVLGLSVPACVALMLALSGLAPARLAAAGAAAGLVAGGLGATAYALHCVETSPGFVLIWYSLGLIAAGKVGASLGPRVLGW